MQLVNKLDGKCFTVGDEYLLQTFCIYSALVLHYSKISETLYMKVKHLFVFKYILLEIFLKWLWKPIKYIIKILKISQIKLSWMVCKILFFHKIIFFTVHLFAIKKLYTFCTLHFKGRLTDLAEEVLRYHLQPCIHDSEFFYENVINIPEDISE